MLLVLSAPSVTNRYYEPVFERVVHFQIAYASAIMGNDNVVVLVDEETKHFYEGRLPEDVLLVADVYDIWARDFTTINPENPVQFRYTWASMTRRQSVAVQRSFAAFADDYDIERRETDLLLDGGNVVDSYAGRVIVTTRFLADNGLSYDEGRRALMDLLDAEAVAIIEADEDVLAHADGMVSWLDEDTLLVNDYSSDPAFRADVMDELQYAFPTATIIEVPVAYRTNPPGQWDDFESACGVNLNATVTYNNVYVPVFDMPHEQAAVDIIRQNTVKNVITVPAGDVCPMGGSVRCLTWQVTGSNAEKLIRAARER